MIPEVAHHMALLPLLWLGCLAFYRQPRSALWWTLALVMAVSWMADTVAHWVNPWLVSRTYPLVQALALGAVLLPTNRLWRLALALAAAWLISAQTVGPDLVTHTVAWSSLVLMVWPPRDKVQHAIVIIFAGTWLGWAAYTIAPGWASWGVYQGIRAVGIGTFCWASAPARVRA